MGIYVGFSSTGINENMISTKRPGAVGMSCFAGYTLIIDQNTVSGDSISFGLRFTECVAEIINSSVNGTSGYSVQNGIFFQCDFGSSMRLNAIENFSERGVYCYNTYPPDLGTYSSWGYNQIVSDSGYNVYYNPGNNPTDSLKAQYNWWGEYPPDPSRF
jgi:hypothetical protein